MPRGIWQGVYSFFIFMFRNNGLISGCHTALDRMNPECLYVPSGDSIERNAAPTAQAKRIPPSVKGTQASVTSVRVHNHPVYPRIYECYESRLQKHRCCNSIVLNMHIQKMKNVILILHFQKCHTYLVPKTITG